MSSDSGKQRHPGGLEPASAGDPPGDPAHASDTLTREGGVAVRVIAQPFYMAWESSPDDGKYIFGYRVRIQNEGEVTVQLIARHWDIADADEHAHEVKGGGVVGRQPRLHPGEGFTYESFCPLETPWGTMEGWYHFEIAEGADTGAPVRVRVDRFYLVADGARA